MRYVSQDDVGMVELRQRLMLSLGDVSMISEGLYQKQRIVNDNFADQSLRIWTFPSATLDDCCFPPLLVMTKKYPWCSVLEINCGLMRPGEQKCGYSGCASGTPVTWRTTTLSPFRNDTNPPPWRE